MLFAVTIPCSLVRIGPAKRRAKRPEDLSDSDSQHGTCVVSEFEDKDDDLSEYLQSNTSFLMAMQTTNAFTATSLCFFYIFHLPVHVFDIQLAYRESFMRIVELRICPSSHASFCPLAPFMRPTNSIAVGVRRMESSRKHRGLEW